MRLDPHFRRTAARCCLPGALSALLLLGCSPAGPLPLAAETAGATSRLSGAGGPAPNIVVVMADDMRFDDLRFAPGLRRLARTGVTFENSFSLLPALLPRARLLPDRAAAPQPRRPLARQAAGLPRVRRLTHPGDRGRGGRLPHRASSASTSTGTASTRRACTGPRRTGTCRTGGRTGTRPSRTRGSRASSVTPTTTTRRPSTSTARGGTTWGATRPRWSAPTPAHLVRKYHRQPDPFLLYVNYLAPHGGTPREADDPRGVRDRAGRAGAGSPRRPARAGSGVVSTTWSTVPPECRAVAGPSSPTSRTSRRSCAVDATSRAPERAAALQITRQRAEAILAMDRDIARTVRTLKRSGEWADTVFVFTSDNGYLLGEHRLMQAKVRGYEPSLPRPAPRDRPGPARRLTALRPDHDGGPDGDPAGHRRSIGTPTGRRRLAARRAGRRRLRLGAGGARRVGVRREGRCGSVFGDGRPPSQRGRADVALQLHPLQLRPSRSSTTSPATRTSWSPSPAARRTGGPSRAPGRPGPLEDCRGSGCLVPLPDLLGVDAATNRRTSRRWLTEHRRRYGWR